MTKRTSAVLLVCALCRPGSGWGAAALSNAAKGTATAGFLELGVGARAIAMGEAYTAVVDEASALYWNPGALTRIEDKSVTLMHAAGVDSSFLDYGAYGRNMGKQGAFGLGVTYFGAGEIIETDDATGADIGTLSPYDVAISIGYAYALEGLDSLAPINGLSLGLAGKYIHSQIRNRDDTGAVDLGLLSPAYLGGRLRFAVTASNLGGKLKFDQEAARLPFVLRTGSSLRLSGRWSAALDLGFPTADQPYAGLGTEYVMPAAGEWSLAGRMGFNSRTIGDVTGFTGVSFGIGFIYRKSSVDYGYVPFGSLGDFHRLSLTTRF